MRHQNPSVLVSEGGRLYIRPFVDKLQPDGTIKPVQERIYLVATTKRAAETEKNAIMAKINRSQYVLSAQLKFGEFLDQYLREYVNSEDNLAYPTQLKYESMIKVHLRPAFGELMLIDVTTARIDLFLNERARAGMAYSSRLSLRNLLYGIFTQADKWGLWKERNPAHYATVGRKKAKRKKQKLTIEETSALLDALRPDVALLCKIALFCSCRISEILGLEWRHIDFDLGVLNIEQRWYRGDIAGVKSEKSERPLSLGYLVDDLRPLRGRPDEYCFAIQTYVGREKKPRVTRDDRTIRRYFLKPVAEALGLDYVGFGFHSLRREAVTAHARHSKDPVQVMKFAGHSRIDMTELYGLRDHERQDAAVRKHQEEVLGLSQIQTGRAN